MKESLEVN